MKIADSKKTLVNDWSNGKFIDRNSSNAKLQPPSLMRSAIKLIDTTCQSNISITGTGDNKIRSVDTTELSIPNANDLVIIILISNV